MPHSGHDEQVAAAPDNSELVAIRLPVWWTFGALIAGLLVGLLTAGSALDSWLLPTAQTIGNMWLNALQATIIPLVASLLVLGISRIAEAAKAGAVARNMLGWMLLLLIAGGLASVIFMPLLLRAFPIPDAASNMLLTNSAEQVGQELPSIDSFVESLVAPNLFEAAATNAMLPLTLFFAVLALAIARLPETQKLTLLGFFRALANAMLIIIGWVLKIAPIGVFALALGVANKAGSGAFATLVHYILTVSAMGLIVMVGAYLLGILGGRISPPRFFRQLLPSQAVAISTQSSLASLPAMLSSAQRLGVRDASADFVLPLSVAIFRATSPAMNLAVAIYVATLAGLPLSFGVMMAGLAVALIISIGSVSLPGTISFVVSIGPICAAMGVPIEALALLVAVEMIPDIMRTLGNVTADVAVTCAVDRQSRNMAPSLGADSTESE